MSSQPFLFQKLCLREHPHMVKLLERLDTTKINALVIPLPRPKESVLVPCQPISKWSMFAEFDWKWVFRHRGNVKLSGCPRLTYLALIGELRKRTMYHPKGTDGNLIKAHGPGFDWSRPYLGMCHHPPSMNISFLYHLR
jgi:hypothetical protein